MKCMKVDGMTKISSAVLLCKKACCSFHRIAVYSDSSLYAVQYYQDIENLDLFLQITIPGAIHTEHIRLKRIRLFGSTIDFWLNRLKTIISVTHEKMAIPCSPTRQQARPRQPPWRQFWPPHAESRKCTGTLRICGADGCTCSDYRRSRDGKGSAEPRGERTCPANGEESGALSAAPNLGRPSAWPPVSDGDDLPYFPFVRLGAN
jgi:hypothetical protein